MHRDCLPPPAAFVPRPRDTEPCPPPEESGERVIPELSPVLLAHEEARSLRNLVAQVRLGLRPRESTILAVRTAARRLLAGGLLSSEGRQVVADALWGCDQAGQVAQ